MLACLVFAYDLIPSHEQTWLADWAWLALRGLVVSIFFPRRQEAEGGEGQAALSTTSLECSDSADS